jgi:hypothetical protein
MIPLEEFQALPHIDSTRLEGRVVPLLPVLRENEWHLWVPSGGKLHELKAQPIEACYFAKGLFQNP